MSITCFIKYTIDPYKLDQFDLCAWLAHDHSQMWRRSDRLFRAARGRQQRRLRPDLLQKSRGLRGLPGPVAAGPTESGEPAVRPDREVHPRRGAKLPAQDETLRSRRLNAG